MSMQLNVHQSLKQQQEMRLLPQQLQSLEILQMNTLELQQRILQTQQQNPLLNLDQRPPQEILEADLPDTNGETTPAAPPDSSDASGADIDVDNAPTTTPESTDPEAFDDDFRRAEQQEKISALLDNDESLLDSVIGAQADDDIDHLLLDLPDRDLEIQNREKRQHFLDSYTGEGNFWEDFDRQLLFACDANPGRLELCRQLVNAFDRRGFLVADDAELCERTGASPSELQEAIRLLQSLDPPGIAARSTRESLLLQLERNREYGSLAWEIVDRFLDCIDPVKIATAIQADAGEVREAFARISQLTLDPLGTISAQPARCIIPDLIVEKNARQEWTIKLNRDALPPVVINQEYLDLLRTLPKSAEKKMLEQKKQEAEQLLNDIAYRYSTMENIALILLRHQYEFFVAGDSGLRPLTQDKLAQELGLSPSTISRAIKDKYISTPHGLYPLAHFFSSGFQTEDGQDLSSLAIRQTIRTLIQNEPPEKPLSDEAIARELTKSGLSVARRTVAKYRDLEKIPTASQRKNFRLR